MTTPQDLEKLIAHLEEQGKQSKRAARVLAGAKTAKIDEETMRTIGTQHDLVPQRKIDALDQFVERDIAADMRTRGLKSYVIACESQKLGIMPLTEILEKRLKKAQEARRLILNRELLLKDGDASLPSQHYKANERVLLSFMEEGPALRQDLEKRCVKWIELSKIMTQQRQLESRCVTSDRSIELENFVLNKMMDAEQVERVKRLIEALKTFELDIKAKLPRVFYSVLTTQSLEEERAKTFQQEKLKKSEIEKQEQTLQLAFERSGDEAKKLAQQEVRALRQEEGKEKHTNKGLLLPDLQKFLREKIEHSTRQMQEFDQASSDKIDKTFHIVFNTKDLLKKLEVKLNKKHYAFLRFLYTANQQYYLSVQAFLDDVREPITLVEVSKLLEKIKTVDVSRLDAFKSEIIKLGITEVDFLTQLLVPAYRLVFKFQQEKLLPCVQEAAQHECSIWLAKLEALQAKMPPAQDRRGTVFTYRDELERILQQDDLPYKVAGEADHLIQNIRESVKLIEQKSQVSSAWPDMSQTMLFRAPVSPPSFLTGDFIAHKFELLQAANTFDIVERLFDSKATVTYEEFYNMLRVLRREETQTDEPRGHVLFQFPVLWRDMTDAPQVTVAIPHRSGMPSAQSIQHPDTITALRNACRDSGLDPETLHRIDEELDQKKVTQKR